MKHALTTLLAVAWTVAVFAQNPAPAADAAAQPPEPDPIMQIDDLLSASGAFFLATVGGDQPKLRPLGAHHVVDGRLWLGVGEFKNVYRQLTANPKCEVVALQPKGGKWLRWTGRAVFAEGEEREKLEEVFLEAAPGLRKIYDKTPGRRMMCFTLENARAELIPLMPPGEILLDETDDAWDKTFPLSERVEHEKVSFHNRYGIPLAADLYRPKGGAPGGRALPAVAVSGPFGAVKEQSSGLYAQHLAENGFVAIAFDPSFTGESGGTPHRMASPDINTEDFLAAVDFLSVRDDVDPEKIGILGICGFGGMAVNAAALDPRIKATVAMTMYDMTKVTREGYFGSSDTTAQRMEARRAMAAQRTADYKAGTYKRAGGVVDPLPEDAPQFVKDYHAYYKTPRGYHPRSGNSNDGWNAIGCQSFLNMPLLSYAHEIATPVLLIHGEKAHSRYFSEYAFEKMTGISVKGESAKVGNKELLIVPGASHVDLYDDVAGVIPHDRIAAFFRENLAAMGTPTPSLVYFTHDISPAGVEKAYKALGRPLEGRRVAVKISTGEAGNTHYLKPELFGPLVRSLQGDIVECNTAYGGSRQETPKHRQTIEDHGFNAIAKVVIMDEFDQLEIPCPAGSTHLRQDLIGAAFTNYTGFVVLNHFKGHMMGGFGGALKNLSIGVASTAGKARIHSAGKTDDAGKVWGDLPPQKDFIESMAEAAGAVVDYMGDRAVYISVMNNLSIDCDCDAHPHPPEMADVGILASLDPVALDKACVDLVYASDPKTSASLRERMETRLGPHILDHAEALGYGAKAYKLVSLDGTEPPSTTRVD